MRITSSRDVGCNSLAVHRKSPILQLRRIPKWTSQPTSLTASFPPATPAEVTVAEDLSQSQQSQLSPARRQSQSSVIYLDDKLVEASADVPPDLILPRCQIRKRQEFDPVEAFVADAVRRQVNDKPITPQYKGILDALRTKQDIGMLQYLLLALRTSGHGETLRVIATKPQHARLIHLVIRLNPFELKNKEKSKKGSDANEVDRVDSSQDKFAVADAQLHLLMAVVSTNSQFLAPTLTALWKMLMEDTKVEERLQRLHAALATILRLCPNGRQELCAVMASHAPFRLRPEAEISWYYSQALACLRYAPLMEGPLMELMVERSLELDVEINISDAGEAKIDEDDEDNEYGDIFELEEDNEALPPKKKEALAGAEVSVDEMADKLDSLMHLLLTHLDSKLQQSPDSAIDAFNILIHAFESSILTTHKSKFVQFLLFYLCGKQNEVADEHAGTEESDQETYRDFAGRLIDVLVDPHRSSSIRQTASCYLASFVSRAVYVCEETVCESVCALLRWASAYIDSEVSSFMCNNNREQASYHALFYTVCQAAFYIMCFRGVDALDFYRSEVPNGSKESMSHLDISRDRWTKICGHRLQPLRFCLESVRIEFIEISERCNLLDKKMLDQLRQVADMASSRPKKHANRISTAATVEQERRRGGVGGLGKGSNPLDSFFPFDPYLLRRSNTFVAPFYNHWTGSISEDTEMGETMSLTDSADVDASDAETKSIASFQSDLSSDDEDDDDRSRDGTDDEPFVPMSIASKASMFDGNSAADMGSPERPRKDTVREAWTDTLKRQRAPSIENGSW